MAVIVEQPGSVFDAPEEYYIVHCISADFALGAGIAREVNARFGTRQKLFTDHPDFLKSHGNIGTDPRQASCLLEGRVFNLVTKSRYYEKPTYQSLARSLIIMRNIMRRDSITKAAMPYIGCGLDRLEWQNVRQVLEKVFAEEPVEFLVHTGREPELECPCPDPAQPFNPWYDPEWI